jgi:hypothetical protein
VTLPPCSFRGIPSRPGWFPCSHPSVKAPGGVTAGVCLGCTLIDGRGEALEIPAPEPNRSRCLHLGRELPEEKPRCWRSSLFVCSLELGEGGKVCPQKECQDCPSWEKE